MQSYLGAKVINVPMQTGIVTLRGNGYDAVMDTFCGVSTVLEGTDDVVLEGLGREVVVLELADDSAVVADELVLWRVKSRDDCLVFEFEAGELDAPYMCELVVSSYEDVRHLLNLGARGHGYVSRRGRLFGVAVEASNDDVATVVMEYVIGGMEIVSAV